MSCSSGGCGTGGCTIKASLAGTDGGGCGSGGCSSGNCGTDDWDGTYLDVVGMKLGNHAKTFYYNSTGFQLLKGEGCVLQVDSGEAFGFVVQPTGPSRRFATVKDLKRVIRRATFRDRQAHDRSLSVRRQILDNCRSKVAELNLEMNVIEVDPSLDGRKFTCYFTAEERIDFRKLVRDMAHKFRARFEMRQIGARDEAKMRGGYGICGRPLCCSTFLTDFAPISVKMAKRQGLSLNPSKISGLCGRLMCCLRYEDYDDPKLANAESKPPPGKSPDERNSSGQRYDKPSPSPPAATSS
jgi:cell fate regulator YaaT (PSP1 superfamily)